MPKISVYTRVNENPPHLCFTGLLFSSSLGSGSLKLRGHHGGGGLRGVTPTTATAEEVEMSLAKPPRSLSVSHHQHQQNRTTEVLRVVNNNSSNSSLPVAAPSTNLDRFNPLNGNLASSVSGLVPSSNNGGLAQLSAGDLAVSPSLPNMIGSSLTANPHRYKTLVSPKSTKRTLGKGRKSGRNQEGTWTGRTIFFNQYRPSLPMKI